MFSPGKTGIIIFTAFALLFIASCTKKEQAQDLTIRVSTSIAPNSIPMLYMMEENLLGNNVALEINLHKSRQEAVAKVVKNEVDFVSISVQEIAQLYNQEVPIVFLDVSNWATFRLITTDPEVNSFEDLKGKELWVSGRGGPIDLVSMAVLSGNGFDSNTDYSIKRMEAVELTQMAINELKGIRNFVLREPYSSQVLLSNPKARALYNLGDEWQRINGMNIPQSGTAAAARFLEEHPKIAVKFTESHKKAVEWTYANPEAAAELGARYLPGMGRDILLESIRNMNMRIESPEEAKEALELYYSMFMEFNPEMIGGKMPHENIYFGKR